MKKFAMRKAMLLLVVSGLIGLIWAADNPFIGTWKMNAAKCKASDASILPRSETAKYVAHGDGVKSTFDGVSPQGKVYHEEWSGKWDGKDYAFISDGVAFADSVTKIDSYTLTGVRKKDGEEVATYRATVSTDGKTLTVAVKGTDPKGQPVTMELVYDKQ